MSESPSDVCPICKVRHIKIVDDRIGCLRLDCPMYPYFPYDVSSPMPPINYLRDPSNPVCLPPSGHGASPRVPSTFDTFPPIPVPQGSARVIGVHTLGDRGGPPSPALLVGPQQTVSYGQPRGVPHGYSVVRPPPLGSFPTSPASPAPAPPVGPAQAAAVLDGPTSQRGYRCPPSRRVIPQGALPLPPPDQRTHQRRQPSRGPFPPINSPLVGSRPVTRPQNFTATLHYSKYEKNLPLMVFRRARDRERLMDPKYGEILWEGTSAYVVNFPHGVILETGLLVRISHFGRLDGPEVDCRFHSVPDYQLGEPIDVPGSQHFRSCKFTIPTLLKDLKRPSGAPLHVRLICKLDLAAIVATVYDGLVGVKWSIFFKKGRYPADGVVLVPFSDLSPSGCYQVVPIIASADEIRRSLESLEMHL